MTNILELNGMVKTRLNISIFLFLTLFGMSFPIMAQDIGFVENIQLEKIIRRVDFDRNKAITKANIILENKIYVFDGWDPVSYKDSISWDLNPYGNRSWVLYFQSLRMVGVLAKAYEYEKNVEYFEKGVKIIKSWDDNHPYEKRDYQNSAWTDHAVANRVLNLEHFYTVFKEAIDDELKGRINQILIEHGQWLFKDKNYKTGNHAIMHDRALIQLAMTLKSPYSKKWLNRGMKRLEIIFEQEITEEGVCVENSPAYHIYVMDLLKDVIDMYEDYGIEVPKYYRTTYTKMKDYLTYVLKPNNKLPCLGDTHLLGRKWYYKKYGTDNLLFVDTRSKMGSKPSQTDKIYPVSGYSIFREGWGNEKTFDKKTFLIQTVSNLSKVHKHSDYLSFELYSNGEDLIVDGGHGGYQKNDTLTFLKSTLAHNTLSVDNANYDFEAISQKDAGIYNSFISDSVSYVRSYFRPSDRDKNGNLEFQRTLFFVKPNIFIVYDKGINLKGSKEFQQFFNLGENLESLSSAEAKKTYTANFDRTILTIKQFDGYDKVKLFHGKEPSLRGLIADGPLKIRKGVQLEFTKSIKGMQEQFVTLFHIHKKDGLDEEKEIKLSDISIQQTDEKIKVFVKGEILIQTDI